MNEIMSLPASVVITAAAAIKGLNSANKQECAAALAALVDNGQTTMSEIRSVVPQRQVISRGDNGMAQANEKIIDHITKDVSNHAVVIGRLSNGMEALQRAIDQAKGDSIGRDAEITDRLARIASQIGATKVEQSAVDQAVAKVVADAFKPFEKMVKAAGAEAVIAEAASIRIIDRIPACDAFGVDVVDRTGSQVMVDIWNHPETPAVDKNFIWSKEILQHLLLSQGTGESLWFGGEKGTGKSETARQFAARTGRGYTRINFHKYSTAADYLGDKSLTNGSTHFECGDFLKAWAVPSTVILLDEITNCPAGELAPLNGLLEPNSAVTIGGAVRTRAQGVLVFAADNTLTNGDETGRYAGTQTMNSALADRFARVIAFKHMPQAQEVDAVTRHTGCDPRLAEHVVELVNACRAKVTSGDLVDAPSIRQVIGFIRALDVLSIDDAWAAAIGNRQPSESATALDAIKKIYLSETEINKLLGI
jgi:MoxR-like ATPase